jgi:hypothetical protein
MQIELIILIIAFCQLYIVECFRNSYLHSPKNFWDLGEINEITREYSYYYFAFNIHNNTLGGRLTSKGIFQSGESNDSTEFHFFELNLTSIDEETFQPFKNARLIKLHDNQFKVIPSNTFKGLSKLEILFLSGNQLSELNDNLFFDLQALEILTLKDNQIKYLQSNIFDSLENLKILDLANNRLTSIDSCLLKLSKNLNFLSLQNNHLKNTSFPIFTNMKYLNLGKTDLIKFDFKISKYFQRLEHLILGDNLISSISESV